MRAASCGDTLLTFLCVAICGGRGEADTEELTDETTAAGTGERTIAGTGLEGG